MPLTADLLRTLSVATPADAWRAIRDYAYSTCAAALPAQNAASEIVRRDRDLAALDLFLATAGWDLWSEYEGVMPLGADSLADWWAQQPAGRAVLILDGLSLREVPWLLLGASARGFTVHQARAMGAEVPADTTPFANALGLPQRSALGNNQAPSTFRLAGATTDTVGLPWADCSRLVGAEQDWVLWHQWPDKQVHELCGAGQGLELLAQDAVGNLTNDDLWVLIERLATGRRLVVTSDHGYAATGHFPDATDEQGQALKDCFKSGRWTSGGDAPNSWVPPVALALTTRHGTNSFVLGRRKWRSQGGYPTLAHGGLSVLEILTPFIELSKGK